MCDVIKQKTYVMLDLHRLAAGLDDTVPCTLKVRTVEILYDMKKMIGISCVFDRFIALCLSELFI